ncbi:MAG: hypothetical protein QM709_03155 [Spongiibacteraceae bacterium]
MLVIALRVCVIFNALLFLPLTAYAQFQIAVPNPVAFNNEPPVNELGIVVANIGGKRTACKQHSLYTWDQVTILGCAEIMPIETMDTILKVKSDAQADNQKQNESDQAILDLIKKQSLELSVLREQLNAISGKIPK